MGVIDADTHTDENEATWDFLLESEHSYRPRLEQTEGRGGRPVSFWIIDGRRHLKIPRDDHKSGTTAQTRELLDVPARLADMDRLGSDVQVIYPSLFLNELAQDPACDLAIRRAYNRWLADRCAASNGRLRWIYVPPLKTLDDAVGDLRWAKEHGAVGIFKKGDREAGHWPADPYFHPLYAEAERQDMPVCFHVGTGDITFGVPDFQYGELYGVTLPVVHAFHSWILNEMPAHFPRLRTGFIEASASWVPFVLYELGRRLGKNAQLGQEQERGSYAVGTDLARDYRMYVSCQVDEDLPALLSQMGDDCLLVGSDYSHADVGAEQEFAKLLAARAARGEISGETVRKMTVDNARRFYAL